MWIRQSYFVVVCHNKEKVFGFTALYSTVQIQQCTTWILTFRARITNTRGTPGLKCCVLLYDIIPELCSTLLYSGGRHLWWFHTYLTSITFIGAKHGAPHRPTPLLCSTRLLFVSVSHTAWLCVNALSFSWLALEALFHTASCSLLFFFWPRVAIFAVVITVFMGASRSALAFIYDSQKGHKRGERGWSLWLPLSAIVRPCLAHPLLPAGIPSLITGHPPRCLSNGAIKAVWESGAFVQLECSAINRLRPKVINCVTKEAKTTTGRRTGRRSLSLLAAATPLESPFHAPVVCPPWLSV